MTAIRNPALAGASVLALSASLFAAPASHAQTVTTVSNGQTVGQQSLGDGDTLIVEDGGTVTDSGDAVVDAVNGTTINIDNAGEIDGGEEGIDASASTLNLINRATGEIEGDDDAIIAGTIQNLDNSGTIRGGLFDGVQATGAIVNLTNHAGGLIEGVFFDAVIADTIENLENSGTIRGRSEGVEASDTIVNLTNNAGGVIEAGPASTGVAADTIQNLTNGGTIQGGLYGVYASDSIGSLTNSGVIYGENYDAIFADNTIDILTNSGLIQGLDRNGIVSGTIDNLVNSGFIIGGDGSLDSDDDAIIADTIQNLENSGTIRGDFDGVNVTTIGSLTNRVGGVIQALEFDAITGNTIQTLDNSGVIRGDDDGIDVNTIESLANQAGGVIQGETEDGVNAVTIESLTNSGAITGDNDGIDATTILNLINSGAITGTGAFGIGIRADIIQNLTNSGFISGGSDAIFETGAADTVLTLLEGSVIDGTIDLGGAATQNTLNIGPGLSLDSVFTSSGTFVVGETHGVPYVVTNPHNNNANEYRVTLADPTALFSQDEMLADLTGGIFEAIGGHLSLPYGQTAPLGYAPDPAPQTAIYKNAEPLARQYWLKGFGAYRDQQGGGSFVDSEQWVGGLVSGLDVWTSADRRAGVFAGGSFGQADVDASQTTDVTSGFGGVYATLQAGTGVLDLAFAAGYSAFESERTVANNLAPGGIETAEADYDGFFISPHIKFTQPVGRFEASGSLRYAGLFLDGFTETGATNNMTVDDREVHIAVVRAALSAPLVRAGGDGSVTRIIPTGGIEARGQFGDDDVSGTLLGQTLVFDGDDEGAVGGFVGLKAEHWTAGGMLVFAESEGLAEDDGSWRFFGKAGVKARF